LVFLPLLGLGTFGASAKADFCFGDAFCLVIFSKTYL